MKRYDLDSRRGTIYAAHEGPLVTYEDAQAAIKAAVEAERDAVILQLETAAKTVAPEGKRTNEHDRHTAFILLGHADAIRARGQS